MLHVKGNKIMDSSDVALSSSYLIQRLKRVDNLTNGVWACQDEEEITSVTAQPTSPIDR